MSLDDLPELVAPQPRMDGEGWLAAARTGALPVPALARWQPLRVGIVNLWEYDRAEFWWADGRLVLRGGNGTGKTKVLELTTLMLLRGEIHPRVLDPFGSKHRTMRYNLLPTGEDDDPRPTVDSSIGYAWAEFGRLDDDGTAHYLICGLGASARRGTGSESTSRWMFLTGLRPGRELELAPGGAPLDEKDLRQHADVEHFGDARRYRAELAGRLFGLADLVSYDNLTELLKQLRKPKLGERLDLAGLARMLRDALPPLETDEVARLVDGWERLARLRGALEATEQAATAVAGFVRSGWRPWARVVVRIRADALAAATSQLDRTTRDRRTAETTLAAAEAEVTVTGSALTTAKTSLGDRETELTELLDSQAFRDAAAAAGRVQSLEARVRMLGTASRTATGMLGDAKRTLKAAAEAFGEARAACEEAAVEVNSRDAGVRSAAVPAGLTGSADRHLPARDIPALLADHGRRAERLGHLTGLRAAWTSAQAAAERTAVAVVERGRMADEARAAATAAEAAVAAAVDRVQAELRDWSASAVVATATAGQLADWSDLVADLTDPTAFDRAGRQLTAALRAHIGALRSGIEDRRRLLAQRRAPLTAMRDEKAAELTAAEDATEHPPPAPVGWRRRDRPGPDDGEGAPFWRCVQPAVDASGVDLDVLEAALAASGLLDAWLTADGALVTADGGFLADTAVQPHGPAPGTTLATVLEPTPDGGVGPATITAALAGIGWYRRRPPDDGPAHAAGWLAGDGNWRLGALTGHAEPVQAASYLGATARERARARTIARLRTEISELDAQLGALRSADEELVATFETLAGEEGRAPDEQPVLRAMTSFVQLRGQREAAERALTEVERKLGRQESARDEARALFAGYAAEHTFPLDGLDDVERALAGYRGTVRELAGAVRVLGIQEKARAGAEKRHGQAEARRNEAVAAHEAATEAERTARIQADEARAALGRDHAAQLGRRTELEQAIAATRRTVDDTTTRLTNLKIRAAESRNTLDAHERARADAERVRADALTAWWEAVDAGLTRYLGLPDPDRRVVETALDGARAARRELTTASPPGRAEEDRAWRRCLEQLQDLRQRLLPNRDARAVEPAGNGGAGEKTAGDGSGATVGAGFGADVGAGDRTIVSVEVLVDETSGWLAPPAAADTLHARVVTERERFDAEQQAVLARLLGSTFIEHLKDRLDSSHATFARINRFLAACPTRQGHTLRLEWSADPRDPEASRVIDALQQGYAELTPTRQEMVRGFLARRIEEARETAAGRGVADWREDLEAALDYRGWLRVDLLYRAGAQGRWRPFDAGRHGSKSGGEKVVLLSQPLFAAAVVAYDGAGPLAPRMVWLDEAMTGVDDGVKAAFMGLLVQFDLDVMLTAHDEWCTYPTVPAAAVYDLARQRHVAGVDALPYLWCGGTLNDAEFAPAGRDVAEQRIAADGLFAGLDQAP